MTIRIPQIGLTADGRAEELAAFVRLIADNLEQEDEDVPARKGKVIGDYGFVDKGEGE